MNIDDWVVSQEEEFERALSAGEISLTEYNESLREVYREARQMANEEAQEAYDDVLREYQ